MAVLVTGAGLVGSLCAAQLLEHGEQPVLYDLAPSLPNLAERLPLDRVPLVRGDLADLSDLLAALRAHRVRAIIHTAGLLTWMVNQRPAAGVRTNLVGTLHVLEAARLAEVSRVVFCSSSTVYFGRREAPPGPLPEDLPLHVVTERPPTVYAAMKLAGEWLGLTYTDRYGLDFAAVRFGAVFGPWRGQPGGGPSQRVQALVEAAHAGRPAALLAGDLAHPGHDYVYAPDAAQGAVRAALAPTVPSRVYNISLGRTYTLRDIADSLERLTGRPLPITIAGEGSLSGYSGPPIALDTTRARAELGFAPAFDLEAALRDYLAWLARSHPTP
ncbi:MAG: NAD(P)-dependent oxidoreductase [Chloroflexi bacterium]|nr:NAD(P)-dependent oxidoreductase [Chloroflexota bacterium]